MGTEIQLTGQGFDKFKWRRELGNVVYAEAAGPLAPISVSPLTPETADLVLFDDDGDREASPDAELWLLPMGGIRGVTVKNSPDGIILSMPVCSGGSDWTLCQALAQTGIECGGEVQVDGQAIPREQALDLTPQANASWQESMETIQQLSAQGHEITLPIVLNQLHLEISPEQLASPTLGDDLVGRMQRIAEAHLASTMVVETQEGQTLHLNVAGGVPTLVAREAQGIVLYDAQDDAAMPGEPLLGGSPVPMERFLDLMGDRVESAGPMIYVPATTFTSDPELMGSLEAAAREANFESAPQAMSSGLDRDLARGPVLVFLLVAAADGVVDEKEVAAFQALLINSERAQGALFRQMLNDARQYYPEIFQEITTQGTPPQLLFVQFLQALDACPPEEALLARQGLYALGHAIASASGGGLLGMGSKISKEERAALTTLQTMLGVNPDDFMPG